MGSRHIWDMVAVEEKPAKRENNKLFSKWLHYIYYNFFIYNINVF
jgi:hypothetical protein